MKQLTFKEVLELLEKLPEDKKQEILRAAYAFNGHRKFIPNDGPQREAWNCPADELFYGGAAGGGKSYLLLGLAIEAHKRSIIFRREYTQILGLVDDATTILGTRDGYNHQDKIWRLPTGNVLEFGSVPHEHDKERFQGRAHDLKGFDEITHFAESQYRFLIGWVRTTDVNQRCRVVVTGNPPMNEEGAWVIKYWGPWLDPNYPNPAKDGELRWFAVVKGKDIEVDGPGPHVIDGVPYTAKSRTFIKARLEDNPELMASRYAATLEGMQEPFRTMLREGRFDVVTGDKDFQVIPTAWVLAAQARWKENGYQKFSMTAMAFDPAGGGVDKAELCWRHGGWYSKILSKQGEETADGSASAATIIRYRRDAAPIVVDIGGGYAGSVLIRLRDNNVDHIGFNGAHKSTKKTKDGKLKFENRRAEAWWLFREALDPDQEGGSVIALPPDSELRADLVAPTYEVGPRGIKIESKDHLRKRLGRSPGKGDVAVMCWSTGQAALRKQTIRSRFPSQQLPPTQNVGYAHMKRGR